MATAQELGASIEALQTYPDFRCYLLRRGGETVVVDLVRDLSPQLYDEKRVVNGIRIDPPEEILANKLCTFLSRAEFRDYLQNLRARLARMALPTEK